MGYQRTPGGSSSTTVSGLDPTGVANATPLIQAAMDAASAAGGGRVTLPQGQFRLDSALVPKDKVELVGAGTGSTTLLPYGFINAFVVNRSLASPLTDATFSRFAIDGANQTMTTYNSSSIKGFYITYLKRCVFRDLYIANTGATGLGIDYLDDVVIDSIVAVNCGRLNSGTDPGGAGIGIGTGQSAVEKFVISNCHVKGNKRYGIFVETQTSLASKGGRIVNCYAEGNAHGFVDAGMAGLVISGCQAVANTKDGFACNAGSLSTVVGQDGVMVGCVSTGNTDHGFHFDVTLSASVGNYSFLNCISQGNSKSGFTLETQSTRAIKGVAIKGCTIQGNGSLGVRVVGTGGAVTDLDIINNTINANGQINATNFVQGIRFDSSATRVNVSGNRIFDNGATKKQTWGIRVETGFTVTDGNFQGNDLRNNLTGGAQILGTLTTCSVGDNPGWTTGTGTPEASVTAPVGTLYRRLDGGASTSLYIKETGTGNTGWRAV